MRSFFFQIWWFPILFFLLFAILTVVLMQSLTGFAVSLILTFLAWIWLIVSAVYQFREHKMWQGILLLILFLLPLFLIIVVLLFVLSSTFGFIGDCAGAFFKALGGR
jgi:hypothetical protein